MKAVKTNLVNKNRVDLAKVIPLKTPFSICIDPCNLCNFKCEFCAVQSKEEARLFNRQFMPFTLYKKAMDDIAEFPDKLKVLRVTGMGEPLLNAELPAMIAYAKEKGIAESIETITNGSRLNPELNEKLINAGVDRIRISVEAISEKGYKEIAHAPLSLDSFLDNIKDLYIRSRGKCEIYIKTVDVAVPENEDQEAFYRMFGDICDKIFIDKVIPLWSDFGEIENRLKLSGGGIHGQDYQPVNVCPYPFYSLLINTDGDVTVCCADWQRKLVIGNVNETPLTQIWNGEKLRHFWIALLSGNKESYAMCQKCVLPMFDCNDNIDRSAAEILQKLNESIEDNGKVKCRVCGSDSKAYETIDIFVDEFNLRSQPFHINKVKRKLYKCPECSHMQFEAVETENYYDTKDCSDASFSWKYLIENKTEKIRRLALVAPDHKAALDIGCGSGKMLCIANKFFDRAVGIEPGMGNCVTARIAADPEKTVIVNDYFGDQGQFCKNHKNCFSAFYSIMVFEHLEQLRSTARWAYEVLVEGGAGLVNVPDGQEIYHRKIGSQLLSEHINLFTPLSLCKLFEEAGFEILSMDTYAGNDVNLLEIDILIRKPILKKTGFSDNYNNVVNCLKRETAGAEHITIWGGGNRSHTYADYLPSGLIIEHLIDSNPEKAGKYINHVSVPVENVTDEIIASSDLIIIFATTFKKEIIEILMNTELFRGKALYFEGEEIKSIDIRKPESLQKGASNEIVFGDR